MSLEPGGSGSCSETVSDTSNSASSLVNVFLVIDTTSSSEGGTLGSKIGTEAVLDGRFSGLQVSVTDTTTGRTFGLGPFSCYADSTRSAPASYPDSSYCLSSTKKQTVASNVGNATFRNTFAVKWSFPLASGNPYQGSGARIQLQTVYVASSGGGTLGASTGPNGGPLAASTPTTGARLPETLGQLLLGAGVLIALVGMFLYMRGGRTRPSLPPTSPR
ncbi:MAG TPA: hypothetical protein VMW80_00580 [Candidatus Dormibacteraeota bacterium]|nr:hypothetical protein [Candidatus Dormibacteraeota bacterium]